MRPHGSAAELEVRRRTAGRLLKEGKGIREVARLVGASPSSVERWKEAMQKGGSKALQAKPHPGPRPRLSGRQKQKLVKVLEKGPLAAGYPTDLWTTRRVAEVIQQTFGVNYHPVHAGRILHSVGWSCQKPERRARERNEEAVQTWRTQRWPHIKKRPKASKKHRLR